MCHDRSLFEKLMRQLEAVGDPEVLDLVVILLDGPEGLPDDLWDRYLMHLHYLLEEGVVGHWQYPRQDRNLDAAFPTRPSTQRDEKCGFKARALRVHLRNPT